MNDYLTASEAAALAGVTAPTFRGYVVKGYAPQPDLHFGRTPGWRRETIELWLSSRPGQGRRTDLADPS